MKRRSSETRFHEPLISQILMRLFILLLSLSHDFKGLQARKANIKNTLTFYDHEINFFYPIHLLKIYQN